MLVVFALGYVWLMAMMAGAPEEFVRAQAWLRAPAGRVFLWASGAALVYHWVNGLRFLALDAGLGESRGAMRFTARLALATGVAAAVALGAALWIMGGGA